jgi:hypothetical protein
MAIGDRTKVDLLVGLLTHVNNTSGITLEAFTAGFASVPQHRIQNPGRIHVEL